MPKLFGRIEEDDIKDLPESLQEAIKAGSEQADKTTKLEATLLEMQKKLDPNFGKTAEEIEAARKEAEAEEARKAAAGGGPIVWNPPVSAMEEMTYNNRMDMIIMRLSSDKDKTIAAAVKLFEAEIREGLNKSHPQSRANEAYIMNVVNLVKGRHMSDILADVNATEKRFNSFYTESASGSNTSTSQNQEKPLVDLLTPEMKKAADEYGVPYERYAINMREMGAI